MAARGRWYGEIQSDERLGKPIVSGTPLATSNRGKVTINMPDVMEQLSKPQSPLSTESPVGEPRRSPVKFIVLGMLLLALATGAWAWFHFRDRVSSDDAQVDAHITAVAPPGSRDLVRVP